MRLSRLPLPTLRHALLLPLLALSGLASAAPPLGTEAERSS